MRVEKIDVICNDLKFLLIKYPESLNYITKIQKLHKLGMSIKHLEFLISKRIGSDTVKTEYEKKRFFRDLSLLVKNKVHDKIIEFYLDPNVVYFKDGKFAKSIIEIYELYRKLRSNGETDVEEEDLVKAILLSRVERYVYKLIKYLNIAKKSELFRRLFIAKDHYEFSYIIEILNFGLTDDEFRCVKESMYDLDRIKQIWGFLLNGIRGEKLIICSNPKLNTKQRFQVYNGFKDGLTLEQVLSYANPEYDDKTMESIRLSLKFEIGGDKHASRSS